MSNDAIDKAEVERLIGLLGTIRYNETGCVARIVGKPAPGEHAPLDAVDVVEGVGLVTDHARKDWWRGARVPGREVTAVADEVLAVLGVDPLVVGDNLITRGIDLTALGPGDLVQVGSVVLERSPAEHRPCRLFRDRTSPEAFGVVARGFRGALFSVRKSGRIATGDAIRVLARADRAA